MRKLTFVLIGLLLSVVFAGSVFASSIEQEINWWSISGEVYGETLTLEHPLAAVMVSEGKSFTFDYDMSDLLSGREMTSAWLDLTFVCDLTDSHGKFWGSRFDNREYAEYSIDGSPFISIDEVDNFTYKVEVDPDQINDNDHLIVTLKASNRLHTGNFLLGSSVLYGNAFTIPIPTSAVPEPTTILSFMIGLLGFAKVSREK